MPWGTAKHELFSRVYEKGLIECPYTAHLSSFGFNELQDLRCSCTNVYILLLDFCFPAQPLKYFGYNLQVTPKGTYQLGHHLHNIGNVTLAYIALGRRNIRFPSQAVNCCLMNLNRFKASHGIGYPPRPSFDGAPGC